MTSYLNTKSLLKTFTPFETMDQAIVLALFKSELGIAEAALFSFFLKSFLSASPQDVTMKVFL